MMHLQSSQARVVATRGNSSVLSVRVWCACHTSSHGRRLDQILLVHCWERSRMHCFWSFMLPVGQMRTPRVRSPLSHGMRLTSSLTPWELVMKRRESEGLGGGKQRVPWGLRVGLMQCQKLLAGTRAPPVKSRVALQSSREACRRAVGDEWLPDSAD